MCEALDSERVEIKLHDTVVSQAKTQGRVTAIEACEDDTLSRVQVVTSHRRRWWLARNVRVLG